MKNDLTCEVVQDLLPSYADGLTSPVTGEAVERHLAACPQCTLALEEMLTPAEITPVKQSEVNYLKRGQRQVVCRCAVLVLTAVYAFLSIRFDGTSILDFIRYAVAFLITKQQFYEWRM